MIKSNCLIEKGGVSAAPGRRNRGFTLTELLVIVVVLGLLGATLLPALAGTRRNSRMAECLANLRQIGAGCSMYAGDFNDWYPLWVDSTHPANAINGVHYVRYVYIANSDNLVMPASYQTGTGPNFGWDYNLGYLYGGGFINDGHAFFCPGFEDAGPSSPIYSLSSAYYEPPATAAGTRFMTTHSNGGIRSSYYFNPRLNPPSVGSLRAYQKSTDVKSRDVFTLDYLASNANPTDTSIVGVPFDPQHWAHWPGRGLDTLFTDGSASFATLAPALFNSVVALLNSTDNTKWPLQYNALYNGLLNVP